MSPDNGNVRGVGSSAGVVAEYSRNFSRTYYTQRNAGTSPGSTLATANTNLICLCYTHHAFCSLQSRKNTSVDDANRNSAHV